MILECMIGSLISINSQISDNSELNIKCSQSSHKKDECVYIHTYYALFHTINDFSRMHELVIRLSCCNVIVYTYRIGMEFCVFLGIPQSVFFVLSLTLRVLLIYVNVDLIL